VHWYTTSQQLWTRVRPCSTAPAPAVPAAHASTKRRMSRRRLLQSTGAAGLTIVTRLTVPAGSLADASLNLGAAFGTGDLLAAVRTALGSQYSESTFRSTASRHAWRESDGVAKSAVASGRISDQLVAADEDPCTSDNGGCHGLVTCTADPSNAATGVLCGQCPNGQGLTLFHFSAQHKRFVWDRCCI